MIKSLKIFTEKWNHEDTCKDGVCSSYTKDGNKIKFFLSNKKWKYDGFVNTKKVSGIIPDEYIDAFDEGNQKLMNKFVKELFK